MPESHSEKPLMQALAVLACAIPPQDVTDQLQTLYTLLGHRFFLLQRVLC